MTSAKLILNPSGVPEGFRLVSDKLLCHPVDGQYGALLQNKETGIYVFHAAGANRSIPRDWAIKQEITKNE